MEGGEEEGRGRLLNRRNKVARAGTGGASYCCAQGRVEILRAEGQVLLNLWVARVHGRELSFHVQSDCLVLRDSGW